MQVMSILSKRMLQHRPDKFQENDKVDDNHFKAVEQILLNERFKAAWL